MTDRVNNIHCVAFVIPARTAQFGLRLRKNNCVNQWQMQDTGEWGCIPIAIRQRESQYKIT